TNHPARIVPGGGGPTSTAVGTGFSPFSGLGCGTDSLRGNANQAELPAGPPEYKLGNRGNCTRGVAVAGRVTEEVGRFAKTHLPGGGSGVVAVSGGADSVALLRALLETGCGPLTVVHLN